MESENRTLTVSTENGSANELVGRSTLGDFPDSTSELCLWPFPRLYRSIDYCGDWRSQKISLSSARSFHFFFFSLPHSLLHFLLSHPSFLSIPKVFHHFKVQRRKVPKKKKLLTTDHLPSRQIICTLTYEYLSFPFFFFLFGRVRDQTIRTTPKAPFATTPLVFPRLIPRKHRHPASISGGV